MITIAQYAMNSFVYWEMRRYLFSIFQIKPFAVENV